MANTYWILVANASEARLYATPKLTDYQNWQTVKTFIHSESRKRNVDLVTDIPGRFRHKGKSTHGAFVEPSTPKEVEAERFAHELATELNVGRVDNAYTQLIIVAPPHFYGLVRKACNSNVLALLDKHLTKDYIKLSEKELMQHLQTA